MKANTIKDHQYLIIPDKYELIPRCREACKAAVFICLYYKNDISYYMPYLEGIPMDIDIYIISSERDVLDSFRSKRFHLVQKENRGRDISALLIAAKPYIEGYDFICFCHDKKEKTKEDKAFLEEWKRSLIENVLASGEYIRNIEYTMMSDKSLGMLVPPPQHGRWRKHYMLGEWGLNYDRCVELADEIGLKSVLREDDPPITYGNTFWARPVALKRLFDRDWKYEDFPGEPLPDDGEINHAIERVMQFVAEEAGYQVKIAMASTYAGHFINVLRRDLWETWSFVTEKYGARSMEDVHSIELRDRIMRGYCISHRRVYLYGGGKIAEKCLIEMGQGGLFPTGLLVTGEPESEYISGVRVTSVGDFDWGDDAGIIVAVGRRNLPEVIQTIERHGRGDYLVYIDLVNK